MTKWTMFIKIKLAICDFSKCITIKIFQNIESNDVFVQTFYLQKC